MRDELKQADQNQKYRDIINKICGDMEATTTLKNKIQTAIGRPCGTSSGGNSGSFIDSLLGSLW